MKNVEPKLPEGAEAITLGAGCFWCTEAVFQQIPGVLSVTSGYMGGETKNPTYEQICTGQTGHAEVARIVFDPKKTSLAKILEAFGRRTTPRP
jgi:peptide-methionine (S)-S-oxide reductase